MVQGHAVPQARGAELGQPPGTEGSREAALLEGLDPGLRRHQDEDAEEQGRDQSAQALSDRPGGRRAPHHEPQGDPRDHEQKGQSPGVGDQGRQPQARHGVRAVHMPVPGRIDEADMVEDEHAEGGDADPVDVCAALVFGGAHGPPYATGRPALSMSAAASPIRRSRAPARPRWRFSAAIYGQMSRLRYPPGTCHPIPATSG